MPVKTARSLLSKFREGKNSLKLPIDPRELAKIEGVRVIADPNLDNDNVSGEYMYEGWLPTIKYNPRDSVKRQRFTIAHELGHHVLKHGHSFRDNKKNFTLHNFDCREVAANKFAAELLMPADAISVLINQRNIKSVVELAKIFDVSVAAMKYRLENLGFL